MVDYSLFAGHLRDYILNLTLPADENVDYSDIIAVCQQCGDVICTTALSAKDTMSVTCLNCNYVSFFTPTSNLS